MKKMKCLATVFSLAASSLYSFCPETYIDFFVGAQEQKASYEINALDTGLAPVTDTYSLQHLRGWKFGVNAKAALGECWYLRGMGAYGRIESGEFSQTSSSGASTTADTKGTTLNLEAAIGYTFFPTCHFSIAPTFGWSYDCLSIYTHNLTAGSFPLIFSRDKVQWGGPFLGCDLSYLFNCHWGVFGQYELHLASTQTKLWTPGSSAETLRGHIRNLIGNLGRLGIVYTTDCGWRFGLNGSYRYYSVTRNGTLSPSAVTGSFSRAHLSNNNMGIAEVLASVGYQF